MKITIEIDGERPSAKRMWKKWKKRRCNREGHDWGEVIEMPWTSEANSPIYMVYRTCRHCGFNQRARSEQSGYSFDWWDEAAARRRT